MSLYELEIGWAASPDERRYLRWELLACDEVCGVFSTARDDTLAVLFNGALCSPVPGTRGARPRTLDRVARKLAALPLRVTALGHRLGRVRHGACRRSRPDLRGCSASRTLARPRSRRHSNAARRRRLVRRRHLPRRRRRRARRSRGDRPRAACRAALRVARACRPTDDDKRTRTWALQRIRVSKLRAASCSRARPATSADGCCGSSRSRGGRCAAWCGDPRRCRDGRLSERRSFAETSSIPNLSTRHLRVSRLRTTSSIRWPHRVRSPGPTVAARKTSRPPRARAASAGSSTLAVSAQSTRSRRTSRAVTRSGGSCASRACRHSSFARPSSSAPEASPSRSCARSSTARLSC